MSNYVIFISYATVDKKTFHIPELATFLRSQPQIQEVLYWEENTSSNIYEYMNTNIERCDVMLMCCSPAALQSDPVFKEWTAADNLNKSIVPVFYNIDHVPILLQTRTGYVWTKGLLMSESTIQGHFQGIYQCILKVVAQPTSYAEKIDQYLLNLGVSSIAEYELLRRTKARDMTTAKQVEEKGFGTVEEMLTAFKFNAFTKKEYDLVMLTLSPSPESALEVQEKGFSTYETMQKAAVKGFQTYAVMQEAEQGGFPTYSLMCQAKEKGFPTFALMQEAQENGFSSFQIMQEAKHKGFPTYALMQEAKENGFTTYQIMQEAKQKGFPTYAIMKAATEKGFFAYDLFQIAQRTDFPTYTLMQEGREKGFPNYATMQEALGKGFPTYTSMKEAKEKGFPTFTWIQEAKQKGFPTFARMLEGFEKNFSCHGAAVQQGSEFILTSSKKDQVGIIWYAKRIWIEFIASFKIWVSGGDGIVFMFYIDKNYTPQLGGYLGFGNKGYGIEIDLVQNSQFNEQFTAPHIGVIQNTIANHVVAYELKKDIKNQWHQVDVEVNKNQIRVLFDMSNVIQAPIQFDKTFSNIGFGAGCGSLKGIQKVKDIIICTSQL